MKSYRSDFDLLVIVNHKRLTDWSEYWYKAEDRLNHLIIEDTLATPINFIAEAWETVTSALARGHYFFSDIAQEGITLYELRGGKPLPEPLIFFVGQKALAFFSLYFCTCRQGFDPSGRRPQTSARLNIFDRTPSVRLAW